MVALYNFESRGAISLTTSQIQVGWCDDHDMHMQHAPILSVTDTESIRESAVAVPINNGVMNSCDGGGVRGFVSDYRNGLGKLSVKVEKNFQNRLVPGIGLYNK